jgi:glyoxylase-like metal-dependent hydrolase (beta-lactamase superfamily II)
MQIGDYRVEIVPDTEFRLDGGAMFGVVPRVLWERVSLPDHQNRVALTCNCIFIDTGREKILVETGMGEKWSEKQTRMYGVSRKKPFAQTLVEKTGCRPEDITIVVNTHLHFDHAGGNTVREASGSGEGYSLRPQFSNARYFVSKSEVDHAEHPHERDRASYLADNWRPLAESGQLELKPAEYEVVPGLRLETVKGHSKTMQTWRLDSGGQTLYGFADLIPTRHHLQLAWIMGYDLFPTDTLEFKRRIIPQAVEEAWTCSFYHDVEMPLGRLVQVDGKIQAVRA